MLAAALELEHNVALVPGYLGVEVSALVYLADELGGHVADRAAVVAVVAREHAAGVVVETGQGEDVAGGVILHLYGRVYAQEQRTGPLFLRGGGCGARAGGSFGGFAAAREYEQRARGGGNNGVFEVGLLHLSHLLL